MGIISNIRQLIKLSKDIDFAALARISEKVDLGEAMNGLGKLDDNSFLV